MKLVNSLKGIYVSFLIFLGACVSNDSQDDLLVNINFNKHQKDAEFRIKVKDVSDFTMKIDVLNNFSKPIHASVNVTGSIEEISKCGMPVEDIFRPWGPVRFRPYTFEVSKHKDCHGCSIRREYKVFIPWEEPFDPKYISNKVYKVTVKVQIFYLKFGDDLYSYQETEHVYNVAIED